MKNIFFAIIFIVSSSTACLKVETNVIQTVSTPQIPTDFKPNKEKQFVISDNSIKIIKPSNTIEKLRLKQKENPSITITELANFGNELLKQNGYDYTFDWKPKGKENEKNLIKSGENFYPFSYRFNDRQGKSLLFQLMNDDFGHPCFSTINIPITNVSEKTMRVISQGKEFYLTRPKDFYLEEFTLLDKTLKKIIRKWKTPIDATPVGISGDGKKIYFSSYPLEQDETNDLKESTLNLAVEISEDGNLKLVDISEIKSNKGVDIQHDKNFTEITYRKYIVENNEYIIKFSYPCT